VTDYGRDYPLGTLRIKTDGKWAATELGEFLNNITMLYNMIAISYSELRLSSFKNMLDIMSSSVDFYKTPNYRGLNNYGNSLAQLLQHFYVGREENLMIPRIRMESPGELELQGERKSFESLTELLRYAFDLEFDDLDGCMDYLIKGAGKKFIEMYGEIGGTLSRIVCEKVSLARKLHAEEKILSVNLIR
jgi:hypothetical protein